MKEEAEKERTLALERERLHKQYQEELKMRQEKEVSIIVVSKIQLVVYYQCYVDWLSYY